MEVHNEASSSSGLNSEKAMYHQYMISRAFIPPWSLVMRDRKLSDQTLPCRGSRNPSFPFTAILRPCCSKVTKIAHRILKIHLPWPANSSVRIWLLLSEFRKFAWREIGVSLPQGKWRSSVPRATFSHSASVGKPCQPICNTQTYHSIHTGSVLLSLYTPLLMFDFVFPALLESRHGFVLRSSPSPYPIQPARWCKSNRAAHPADKIV